MNVKDTLNHQTANKVDVSNYKHHTDLTVINPYRIVFFNSRGYDKFITKRLTKNKCGRHVQTTRFVHVSAFSGKHHMLCIEFTTFKETILLHHDLTNLLQEQTILRSLNELRISQWDTK